MDSQGKAYIVLENKNFLEWLAAWLLLASYRIKNFLLESAKDWSLIKNAERLKKS